jgi:hypothetical protein
VWEEHKEYSVGSEFEKVGGRDCREYMSGKSMKNTVWDMESRR